jgi:hypothetical protein
MGGWGRGVGRFCSFVENNILVFMLEIKQIC